MSVFTFLIDNFFNIFALGCLVGAGLLFYLVYKREQAFEKKEEKVFADADKILGKARLKARDIVEKATDQSVIISKETKNTNEHVVEDLDYVLQESLKRHIEKFNSASDQLLVEYQTMLGSLQKKLFTSTEEKNSQMDQEMDEMFQNHKKLVEQKTKDDLRKVAEEIQQYKKDQEKQIADATRAVFLATYREVLDKSITLTVHDDLVVAALEKAKKEGAFASWQTEK